MMKIVVLDGFCLNPGDLSWDGLRRFGEVEIFDRTAPEDTARRLAGATIALMNKTPLGATVLKQARDLRYVGVLATGYNVVDVAAARAQGMVVTNIPAYGTASVAQFVFALLLELCNRVELHAEAVRAGEWERCADYSFSKSPLVEVAGKTMGIVGFGRIGRMTARIADAFGMRVIAASRTRRDPPNLRGFCWVTIEELLRESDVVSLHLPLLPETHEIINARTLAMMKSSAFLVNTSRGGLIDIEALANALNLGTLAGAALDVLPTEPPAAGNPLLAARNCIVTPHMAWATIEARRRLMDTAIGNVAAFVAGERQNVVS
jgi:glycerate dehydrogenase